MMPLAMAQNTLAMALGTSSLLTQLSIVVITVVNNILLVKYGAGSAYGADISLAAFVVIMKLCPDRAGCCHRHRGAIRTAMSCALTHRWAKKQQQT